jgi:hypothetical protein
MIMESKYRIIKTGIGTIDVKYAMNSSGVNRKFGNGGWDAKKV